jgi:hypothetical protein
MCYPAWNSAGSIIAKIDCRNNFKWTVDMKKRGGYTVVEEIPTACAESLSLSYVTLNEANSGSYGFSSDSYQLQIVATLNHAS